MSRDQFAFYFFCCAVVLLLIIVAAFNGPSFLLHLGITVGLGAIFILTFGALGYLLSYLFIKEDSYYD